MDLLILDAVRRQADVTYPRDRLDDIETALMCFCAAFVGRQDCIWLADAGISATAIDTDEYGIEVMKRAYPDSWEFVTGDVYDYAAKRYAEGMSYDLVSLDPSSNQFDQAADLCPLWCGIADKLVIIGTGEKTVISPPFGWKETDRVFRSPRYGGCYWAVLEPTV